MFTMWALVLKRYKDKELFDFALLLKIERKLIDIFYYILKFTETCKQTRINKEILTGNG